MPPIHRFALLLLLLAPCLALAQSYTVSAPFAAATYKPMDGQERWQRWWSEDGGSTALHTDALTIAAFTQTLNVPPQWGRTTGGLARRVGNEYASFLVGNTIHESLAAAAGTDPRYFPCACTGLFRRTGHALEMTVLTYTHSGRKTVDIPQLSGEYGSEMIATLWYPRHYSPLVQGVQVGHVEMGLLGAIHVVQEFAPEMRRFFHVRAAQPAVVK